MRVVPDSRFVLHGRVTQAGYPLKGASVKLTSASGDLTSVVDDFGNYMLAPVAGEVVVRTELEGYAAETRRLTIGADERIDLELRPAAEPADAAGVYRLTFSASPSCSLPAQARQRSYPARVIQGRTIGRPEDLIVTLAGAEFVAWAMSRDSPVRARGTRHASRSIRIGWAIMASSN